MNINIPTTETVTFVIPLYGFTNDVNIDLLDYNALRMTLLNLKSKNIGSYIIFVGENGNTNINVLNVIEGMKKGGNVRAVETEKYSSLAMYLNEGIRSALELTSSNFIICVSPFVMLQQDTVDRMIDILNKGEIGIYSGFDARIDGVSDTEFEGKEYIPIKYFDLVDINLFGFHRNSADNVLFDTEYRSRKYLAIDLWNSMRMKGYECVNSNAALFWSLDIDWSSLDTDSNVSLDKDRFIKKWRFEPTL